MKHTKKCPSCGTEYSQFRNRCPKCGSGISAQALTAEDAISYVDSMQRLGQSGELVNQGVQLFLQGRFAEAELLHRKATEVSPENAVAHGNLGHVLLKQGKAEEAIPCLEKALALDRDLEGVPQALKDARLVLDKKHASLTDSQVSQLREAAPRPFWKRMFGLTRRTERRVRFVKKYQQTVSSTFGSNICTYERYKAESVRDSLAFLKTKQVSEGFYYVEVDTPEGLVGKDVKGVYRM